MYQGLTFVLRLFTLSAMLLSTTIGMAQNDDTDTLIPVEDDVIYTRLPVEDDAVGSSSFIATDAGDMNEMSATAELHSDSLQLRQPRHFAYGAMPIDAYWPSPMAGGICYWPLHKGLNVSLSAAAIFGLGRYGGSGFANGLSLAYAGNITPRLSYAIGAYGQLLNYGSSQLRDAGVSAMLDYRIDNHWEATAFVEKSIIEPRLPRQLYWLDDVGDKIGASLHYHFNPSLSIGISVWSQNQPYPPPR